MQKGVFIVLEGGEGVGKTTQIDRLKEYLPQAFPNREFVFTREPGGSPFADQIRALIFTEEGKHASPRTLFGLFLAARIEHVTNVVEPALARGAVVICDRYLAATYAYQIVAQEESALEELFWAHTKLVPQPKLTLLFDVDPTVSQQRVNARPGEKTHFDTRSLDFHERIRAGYKKYFEKASENKYTLIDAVAAVEEVWKQVEEAVVSAL